MRLLLVPDSQTDGNGDIILDHEPFRMPKSIVRYWLAMNATAFDSAVHSCVIFFGAAGVSVGAMEAGYPVFTPLDLKQLALVFVCSFGWAILKYLDAHPLEQLLPKPENMPPLIAPGYPEERRFQDALDRVNAELEKGGSISASGAPSKLDLPEGSRPTKPSVATPPAPFMTIGDPIIVQPSGNRPPALDLPVHQELAGVTPAPLPPQTTTNPPGAHTT